MNQRLLESLKFNYQCPITEADFELLESNVQKNRDRLRSCRFFRLDEILHDGKSPQREAMQNVLSAISICGYNFVYIIRGDKKETKIYLGVSVADSSKEISGIGDYAHDILEASFQGMFRGSKLQFLETTEVERQIFEPLDDANYLSLAIGIPSLVDKRQKKDDSDFQGIDRLISSMHGENWMMIVVCEPMQRSEIAEIQQNTFELYENLILEAKLSEQKSESKGTGTSNSVNDGFSKTVGSTTGSSKSSTFGTNSSSSYSEATTTSVGKTVGESFTSSHTEGKSSGDSSTKGTSEGSSHTEGTGKSQSKGWSASKSHSKNNNSSESTADNGNQGSSTSESNTTNSSTNASRSENKSKSTSDTDGKSRNTSDTNTKGSSTTNQTSNGKSENTTHGTSEGSQESSTTTKGSGKTESENISQSHSLTRERIDKKAAEIIKFIDEHLIPRLHSGINKGMYKTAVYLISNYKAVNQRLCNNIKAIFQGDGSNFNPITISCMTRDKSWIDDFRIHKIPSRLSHPLAVIHGLPFRKELELATYLNCNEVAILAGIPLNEIPGVALRQYIPFGLNAPQQVVNEESFELGKLIYGGGILQNNPVYIDKRVLNRHAFVTGLTGSGKTMTCKQLLKAANTNFLVIEPAKTEYRELLCLEGMEDIIIYSIGDEKGLPLRFNPFELLPGENLTSHIDMIKAAFVSSLDFEASMPQILEIAIYQAYRNKGWDTEDGTNSHYDSTKDNGSVWPTLTDVLGELEKVVKDQKFGAELEGNYRGSLISRIKNLTYGAKGKMLDCRKSIDFLRILHSKVVFELEELKSPQDKALIMALIMARLAEAVKIEYRNEKKKGSHFSHISIVEEAHRLLTKSEHTDDAGKRYSIAMFTDMLAEIRKYGESMIIVDQIPNKMAEDVLKNTATKIVHKIVAKDDKEAMGNTMMLNDEQKSFLSNLLPGCAVIFTEKWHKASFAKINEIKNIRSEKVANKLIKKRREEAMYENRAAYYPELALNISEEDFLNYHHFSVKYISILKKLICYWHKTELAERNDFRNILLEKENGFTDKEINQLVKGFILSSQSSKIRNADEQGKADLRNMIEALINPSLKLSSFEETFYEGLRLFKIRK